MDDDTFKTDTYKSMEKMIINLNKYRDEYCGKRKPIFMHEVGSKVIIEEPENLKGLSKKSKFNVSTMSG